MARTLCAPCVGPSPRRPQPRRNPGEAMTAHLALSMGAAFFSVVAMILQTAVNRSKAR